MPIESANSGLSRTKGSFRACFPFWRKSRRNGQSSPSESSIASPTLSLHRKASVEHAVGQGLDHPSHSDLLPFLQAYPLYRSPILDQFRVTEFARLDAQNYTYIDYTGSSLYPQSLVSFFANQLCDNVFGNPHSTNPASVASSKAEIEARDALLDFLDADKSQFQVVWTQNATGAMRIVGEGFDYGENGRLIVSVDSHNSMNGLRAFATKKGATVDYVKFKNDGKGLDTADLVTALSNFTPTSTSRGLFTMTAQSNISGFKAPLSIVQEAHSRGYTVLVDAAALVPTSKLSLRQHDGIDCLAISLYKMFGFPTGVGALIVRSTVLETLDKPWFSGGNVNFVQVPGTIVTLETGYMKFMDGTPDFLSLLPIPKGLEILSSVMPEMERRLPTLVHWTIEQLNVLKHENGEQLVEVRSPMIGISMEELKSRHGALIVFEIVDELGSFVSSDIIEFGAGKQGICVRSGCMCNPGGAAVLMGTEFMLARAKPGATKWTAFADCGERAAGLCRASFGMASNFKDAWVFVNFIKSLSIKGRIQRLRNEYHDRDREVSSC